ncbi:hypothetical protein KP2612_004600 [Komagataella phaffii]|uniref:Uncharacterized protein n=1 Tax=Komagataella phaffii (strain GS115 / ATCC 20864) TaxID=644223 RepID=C4R7C7_KOMPG|nr:Hypothetical protein PAS_chr4_0268 [Komagataella phaffii GS115]AOA64396.1 GQ67_04595T0 [Komagataella phaffii]AOA69904.1 GQ68_04567T0 [Komagataella phaffii GS115]CAH2451126.1 Hypothetical protein BQ9382_C4-3875 [Komagataella phaffii CBS 7435]CAY71502.1 Hypothetical protein PAS_chr4_0268 [Komagataella phaffii GS115]
MNVVIFKSDPLSYDQVRALDKIFTDHGIQVNVVSKFHPDSSELKADLYLILTPGKELESKFFVRQCASHISKVDAMNPVILFDHQLNSTFPVLFNCLVKKGSLKSRPVYGLPVSHLDTSSLNSGDLRVLIDLGMSGIAQYFDYIISLSRTEEASQIVQAMVNHGKQNFNNEFIQSLSYFYLPVSLQKGQLSVFDPLTDPQTIQKFKNLNLSCLDDSVTSLEELMEACIYNDRVIHSVSRHQELAFNYTHGTKL